MRPMMLGSGIFASILHVISSLRLKWTYGNSDALNLSGLDH